MELWKTVAVAMTGVTCRLVPHGIALMPGRQLDTKPGGFAARATVQGSAHMSMCRQKQSELCPSAKVKQSSRQQEGAQTRTVERPCSLQIFVVQPLGQERSS